jgi:hypothetical protein
MIRRHYAMPPFSNAHVCVRDTMDEVHHAPWARLLMPFGRLFGALVPYTGSGVPIEVQILGRLRLPLPLGLLLGTACVEERPDPHDADRFTMRRVLRHRWFGDVFRYSGRFRLGPQ